MERQELEFQEGMFKSEARLIGSATVQFRLKTPAELTISDRTELGDKIWSFITYYKKIHFSRVKLGLFHIKLITWQFESKKDFTGYYITVFLTVDDSQNDTYLLEDLNKILSGKF
jgi:hypothetical protein